MKKTLLAGILLAAFSMTSFSAKTLKTAEPEEAKLFRYVISYVTEKVGNCQVTYKVTTKYFFCKAISSCKQVVSRNCDGGGTGSNSNR